MKESNTDLMSYTKKWATLMFKNTTSTHIFILLLFSLFIVSCAQVVAPSGGPIDKTSPKILHYLPDSAQLNFTSKSIKIDFDEFIQLHDLNNQLIISPPLKYTPDISVKNKSLVIELNRKEILKPNTTYCINFGNALQDFNENNAKENFNYIFSTGSVIDSLTVKGNVRNAFDLKTEKGIVVMLYNDLNDSCVYKQQPDYFAKTVADGSFQLNNIKNGTYKIVAIKDDNSNYKYDGESEKIGFINKPIVVSEKKNIALELFQEPSKKVFLKKYIHHQYGKITFIFNQGSDSIRLIPLNVSLPSDQVIVDFSKNKDTLTYWLKKYTQDSLKLILRNGNIVIDTVEIKMIRKAEALRSKKDPLKLQLLNNFNGNQSVDLNSIPTLIFSHPLNQIETTANFVDLKQDSVAIKTKQKLQYNTRLNYVYINYSDSIKNDLMLKENTNYQLFIPPGTFTDIFGLTNDTIKINFKTREEVFYGTIKLNITVPETKKNYIVQLLDEQEKILAEHRIKKSEELNFKYLYPKKYMLKLIYDTNNNGKWDSGNYLKKQQPEKVLYNKEIINIRSNWDVDLEWKINE